jgi:CelD/BcsL family acetyltransferase involved in cellulose biosynthesis
MGIAPVLPKAVGSTEPVVSRPSDLHVRFIDSIDRLLDHNAAWDDLWRRSDVANPGARSAIIGNWVKHFAPNAEFRAIVVEQEGRWVAALPLVGRRLMKLVTAGELTRNAWSATGELLLDPDVDTQRVLDRFVSGLGGIEWPLLCLDQVAIEAPRWKAFLAALSRAELPYCVREHYRVARVDIGDDWAAYESQLKGKHRRTRRRYARKFEQAGEGRLRVCTEPALADLDGLLRHGFEVEDRSWKGKQGTSILRKPGVFEYYSAEAQQLAETGELRLVFLELDGRPIAFTYLWSSQGVVYVVKTGYDAEFARLGPGQLMMMYLFEHLHADATCRLLDFAGPCAHWQEPWATSTYPVGRIIAATPHRLGREMVRIYSTWQPRLHSLEQTPAFIRKLAAKRLT